MRSILSTLVIVLACASCSGGPSGDPRFKGDAANARPATSPAAEKQAAGSGNVRLPDNLPPASMFLASGAHRTTPSRYCLEQDCVTLKPVAPPALEGPSESPVLFTLSAAPVRARLEIALPGKAPEVVALTPGSSMAWQPAMPPGTYRLTLTAVYDKTEVSWPFAVRIVEGARR